MPEPTSPYNPRNSSIIDADFNDIKDENDIVPGGDQARGEESGTSNSQATPAADRGGSKLRRIFSRKKGAPVSADAVTPDPVVPTPDGSGAPEAETVPELNATARDYLMFLDMIPENADDVSPETIAQANAYATTLESIKDDPNFEPIVTQIREKFNDIMYRLHLEPSTHSKSESWTYWDMAKQKYINDHPDQQDTRYRIGDPLKDEVLQDQIASRQLGWEIYSKNSVGVDHGDGSGLVRKFQENVSMNILDKDNPNYPEIMELLKKDAKPENDTLSSVDLTRLGALIRQNLGEENVSVPEKKGAILGRMWKGEYISQKEKDHASAWEETAWNAGKFAAGVTKLFGAGTAFRLADRWAKRNARLSEAGRIMGILAEEKNLRKRLDSTTDEDEKKQIRARLDQLNVGESETGDVRIQQRMNSMRKEIKESKFLSQEKKVKLEERLRLLEERWIKGEAEIHAQMAADIDIELDRRDAEKARRLNALQHAIEGEISSDLDENVGEKAKKMDYVKETVVGGVGVVSGAFTIRLAASGAIALGERFKNLHDAKKDGERVTPKELIVDGLWDMAREMFGQGRLKGMEKGRKKNMAVAGTWAKAMVPAMIALAGFDEVRDYGSGTFSKSIQHAIERSEEVQKAWTAVMNGSGDAAKAVLLTLNWQETFHRTFGLFKGLHGHAPDAAQSENLAKGVAPSAGAFTPEDTAALNTPHAEHSGAISAAEASRVAQVAEVEPTPGPITAETLKYDALKNAGVQGGAVPDAQVEPSAPAETNIPKSGENLSAPREAVASNAVAGTDSIPPKVEPLVGAEQPTSWMLNEQRIINLESSFGVDSADGITPEDVQKVAAQLQGVNADSADELLKSWQGTHPEIANSIQESRALVGLEKALGVNSFEGQVSPEELKKVIAELAGENKENADKLLAAWESKGLIGHDAVLAGRFPIEHPSIEHAGFQTETADAKVDLALDLGKEGAPKFLEQVFYRMALDDANIGGEITNLEGARILNVGANMTALSEGHDIAGVSAETFAKYVTVADGKLAITNFAGFHEEVLSKLTAHAEQLITADNVGNSGAIEYLNNIKNETWADMAKPIGAEVNLDQAQIEHAEARAFNDLVDDTGEQTGLDKNITNIEVNDENTGSFKLAGELVPVDHGMISGIGDTHFDQPIPLDSEAGHAKLLEEANRIEAQRIEANNLDDTDDDIIGDASVGTDADDDDELLDLKTTDNAVTPDNNTTDTKPAESTDSAREIPRSSLNPIPKTEIPEGMTIKATPEADHFMRQNGIRIFNGQIIGDKLLHKIDFIPEPGPDMNAGTTQAVDFKMTENGNMRVIVTDTDGLKAIQEVTSAGKIIHIQGAENLGTTPPEIPVAPDASSAAETAGDQLETVKTPDGITARFTYDNTGNVTGVNVEGSTSGESGSLQDNFREKIKSAWEAAGKKGDIQLNIDKVEMEAGKIDLHRSVLSSMQAAGQGNSPEAEFMRQQIERAIEHTEKIYGDVFKNSPAESIPTNIESSVEIPASPLDVKLAMENLVTGILSDMDNVSPEVLKALDGIGLDDIAKINNTTLLENIREGARGVIEEIKANPPYGSDTEVLAAVTRGNNAIIEVIDARLSKLKA
ncbi:MAG: hypothetical protein WCW66_02580 [Patescibacteria group bacterium]